MPDTGLGKYTYPNTGEVPDVPASLLALIQDIIRNAEGVTNATERAALVTNGYAFEEMFVYQRDTKIQYVYRSAAWVPWNSAWISYTPTVTGPTSLGTGSTVVAQYRYEEGRVRVKGRITLGTSPNMSTAPILTLPMTFVTTVRYGILGLEHVFAFDTSAAGNPVAFVARHEQTDFGKVNLAPWSGTAATALNTTTPFTWAVGDTIDFDFVGDPA